MKLSAIQADIDFLCGSTSASYPTAAKNRNINIAYADVARLLWESSGGWQYDDQNATTLPVAKGLLVHNQQDYQLPSTAQRVHKVTVKDTNGTEHLLHPIDIHNMATAPSEFVGSNSGLPQYYDLVGSSINLYPIPSSAYCTMASGIAVYVDRDVTEITAASATPGFATPFHRILSYAAVLDFTQDDSTRKFAAAQKARLENGMQKFYSKRWVEKQPSVTPKAKKAWRQYL